MSHSLSTPSVRERLSVTLLLVTWAAVQALVIAPGLAMAFAVALAGIAVAVVSGPRS